jgi:hypothetical protein
MRSIRVSSSAITVLGLLMAFATRASAQCGDLCPPDLSHSTVPSFVRVGGAQTESGTADPTLAFTMTIRDFANQPMAGMVVTIDFVNCSELRLCTAVSGGTVVDCTSRTVRAITNVFGQAQLSLLGAGVNGGTVVPPAIADGAGRNCARVYADGQQLTTMTVALYDQNGAVPGGNGVNALDLSIAKTDVGAIGLGAPYRGRSDYTGDGAVTAADLAALRTIVGQSGLGLGSGAGCASGGASQAYCP